MVLVIQFRNLKRSSEFTSLQFTVLQCNKQVDLCAIVDNRSHSHVIKHVFFGGWQWRVSRCSRVRVGVDITFARWTKRFIFVYFPLSQLKVLVI